MEAQDRLLGLGSIGEQGGLRGPREHPTQSRSSKLPALGTLPSQGVALAFMLSLWLGLLLFLRCSLSSLFIPANGLVNPLDNFQYSHDTVFI